jgi:pyruvate dehydrogenase E1 component beta subunit
MLHPLDVDPVLASVQRTGRLIVVEDGSIDFGIGAELVARLTEAGAPLRHVTRIGAEPVPIPSVTTLEHQVLPTLTRIFELVSRASQRPQP